MASHPPLEYARQSISSLSPGPQQVSFQGTITNITSYTIDSRSSQAAKGCLKLLLWDCNAAILVKIWYDQISYNDLLLGHEVQVSTTHISSLMTLTTASSNTTVEVPANIMTSIFPEKDAGCNVELLTDPQCRMGSALAGTTITGLSQFFEIETRDKPETVIMVIILAVGETTTITTKSNTTFEVLDLEVIDNTSFHMTPTQISPSILSITRPLFNSVATFTPKQTAILITNPKLLSYTRQKLKLTLRSQVFVDPNTTDAAYLRAWANRILPDLPLTIAETTQHPPTRIRVYNGQEKQRRQYTFALFLDGIQLRQQQSQHHRHHHLPSRLTLNSNPFSQWRPPLTGYVSALVTSLPLLYLFDSAQLFCGRCHTCKADIHANIPTTLHTCSHPVADTTTEADVKAQVQLQWNTSLLGGVADETGGLELQHRTEAAGDRHNLLLTEAAVYGLTGLKRDDFATIFERNAEAMGRIRSRLSSIEERVRWERVTLILEWTDQGVITVLDVLR